MGDLPLRAFHQRVFLVAIIIHAVAAWFSSGYYAADEHYQVIEFAQARLGDLPTSALAWEYDAHIRSALLPSICFVVFKAAHAVGLHNPFHLTFLLRALTAIIALLVVRRFVKSASPLLHAGFQRAFILLSYFLWFLPYQHVRFSSESWAGLLFLLGLSTFISGTVRGRSWLVTGLAFGFCVLLKPVMGLPCASAMAWWLVHSSTQRVQAVRAVAAGTVVLLIGVLVDSWFYGDFTLTTWNYVHRNTLSIAMIDRVPVVLEPYPWFYYIPWIIKYGIWPIGGAVLASLCWLTYRSPRSPLVWCIWPYLIMLSMVPHKEVRFLFPLVDLAPLLLILAWQEADAHTLTGFLKHRAVMVPLVVINAIGLLVSVTTAAGSGRARLAEVLWADPGHDPATIGYDFNEELIWKARIPSFYLPTGIHDIGISDPCGVENGSPETTHADLLVANSNSASGCTAEGKGFRAIARSEAPLATYFRDLYNSERFRPYLLYAREARTSPPSEQ